MAKNKKLKKYGVPKSAITERGLKQLIKQESKNSSSVGAWAEEVGLTRQVVSAFLNKTQGAGLKIPEVLGYRPQIVFLPVSEEPIAIAYPPRRPAQRPSSKVDHTKEPIEKKGLKQKNERKEAKKRLKAKKKA